MDLRKWLQSSKERGERENTDPRTTSTQVKPVTEPKSSTSSSGQDMPTTDPEPSTGSSGEHMPKSQKGEENTKGTPGTANNAERASRSARKLPCRPGIVFEAGARLEAQDYLHKWYPSRIEKVDLEQGKILIHFERWNHRYDEWLSCGSPRLRPLQRTSLRREGLREEQLPEFKVGEEVLARWIDCRYYPAKVASLCREGTYTVCFYDGVTKSVKGMNVKPMPDDLRGQDLSTLVKSVGREASSELGSKEHGGCVDDDEQEEEQEQEQEQERKPEQEQEQEQEPTEESDISLHQAPLFEHPNSGETASSLPCQSKESKTPETMTSTCASSETNPMSPSLLHSEQAKPTRTLPPRKATRIGLLRLKHAGYTLDARGSCVDTDVSPDDALLAGRSCDSPDGNTVPTALQPAGSVPTTRSGFSSTSELCGDPPAQLQPPSSDTTKKAEQVPSEQRIVQGKRKEREKCLSKEKEFVKLKKKKKKKKRGRRDSLDGGSTNDSCESEVLRVDTANLEAESSAEDEGSGGAGGSEVVRCSCGINEETGFMIQCESCCSWQHSECMGFSEDNVPDKFFCHECRDPQGQHWSSKFAFDPGWLWEGSLTGLTCLGHGCWGRQAAGRAALQHLLAELLHVRNALRTLQLHLHIAQTQDHPDLKLWSSPWTVSPSILNPQLLELPVDSVVGGFHALDLPYRVQSESEYIRSEHCYQKPVDTGLLPESRRLWLQQFCTGLNYSWCQEEERAAPYASHNQEACRKGTPSSLQGVSKFGTSGEQSISSCNTDESSPERPASQLKMSVLRGLNKESELESHEGESRQGCSISAQEIQPKDAGTKNLQESVCQQNLLKQIEMLQEMVARRMDFIAEQLTALEELFGAEQQDEADVLGVTKDTVRQMMIELQKVQQIAALCM